MTTRKSSVLIYNLLDMKGKDADAAFVAMQRHVAEGGEFRIAIGSGKTMEAIPTRFSDLATLILSGKKVLKSRNGVVGSNVKTGTIGAVANKIDVERTASRPLVEHLNDDDLRSGRDIGKYTPEMRKGIKRQIRAFTVAAQNLTEFMKKARTNAASSPETLDKTDISFLVSDKVQNELEDAVNQAGRMIFGRHSNW